MPPQWIMHLKLLPAAFGFLLIALLIRRGLGKRYAAFLLLIFTQSTNWVVGDQLPPGFRSPVYIGSAVVGWVLYTYIVCEMFGRIFGDYPGIARTGRRVIAISMLIALGAAMLTAELEFSNEAIPTVSTGVLFATIGERVISVAIVGYLILILFFLHWMPVPLPENIVRHSVIFFFHFSSGALLYHFWHRTTEAADRAIVNPLLALMAIVCYAAWAWLLRPEGESTAPARKPPTPDAQRILSQLEAINRALGRSMAGH